METKGQDMKQGIEENDVLRQFAELLRQQDMGEQSQDFMELFRYVAGMQLQLGIMADELQGVREQLAQMQEHQPKAATESLMDKTAELQEKIANLSERLLAVKDRLVETAAQAVNAFKEKGKEEMCRVFQKGISSVKSLLGSCREQLADIMTDYEKTASQIDSIGNELKQIGNSFANVGRLLTGKGAKEVSDEKQGVGLTRAVNKPVKSIIASLRKNLEAIDRASDKLDRLSERLDAGKETEKGGRESVKDKLTQMKAKAAQQKKEPEPDKMKSKSKEESL